MMAVGATTGVNAQSPATSAKRVFQAMEHPTARNLTLQKGESSVTAVEVDLKLIGELAKGDAIVLNPVENYQATGIVDSVELIAGNRVVTGHLEGVPYSAFTFAVVNGIAAASIDTVNEGRYLLRFSPEQVQVVSKVDSASLPDCGVDHTGTSAAHRSAVPPKGYVSDADFAAAADAPTARAGCGRPDPVYDLMVFYTPAVIAAAGSESAVQSTILVTFPSINASYTNSLIHTSARLVYMGFVNYNENGTFEDHRNRFQDFDDGTMDVVNQLRDQYQADILTLLVNDDDGGTLCGMAYCATDQDLGFCVVNYGCAQTSMSWQHEIGHLQGCAHDPANAGPCGLHDNSRGYLLTDTLGNRVRTIMAYNAAPGYQRINWFSNPNVMRNGSAMGTQAEYYNAATVEETRFEVERFRSSRFDMWVRFDYGGQQTGLYEMPFQTLGAAQGWCFDAPALAMPTVHLQPGNSTERPTLSKPMIVDCCGGIATIGL